MCNVCTSTAKEMCAKGMSSSLTLISEPVYLRKKGDQTITTLYVVVQKFTKTVFELFDVHFAYSSIFAQLSQKMFK